MDHDRQTHRTYNEKEIGALIQRATELHERATGASGHSLSLQEIEHIAAELGLPPEHVQTAALEFDTRENLDKSFSFWGAPFVIDQTRVVNEAITEEQWEDIVLELRRFSGSTGNVSTLGRARQWSDEGYNFEKTQVTIRPGDGRTSIQIRKHYDGAAVLYPVVFGISAFFGLIVFHSLPDMAKFTEVALAGLSGLGSLGAVRAFISWRAKRHAERLTRMADRLREILSASSSPVLETEPASGLIELPEQDESTMEMDESERITPEARRGTRV